MSGPSSSIARNYAQALFELYEQAELEESASALEQAAKLWDEQELFQAMMLNPAVPPKEREAVLQDIANKLRPGDSRIVNLFRLLLENQRLPLLPEIAAVFRQSLNNLKELLAVEIRSAFPLDEQEQRSIEERLHSDHGTMTSITWSVNPELLGGLQIKSGDRLLDSSLAGELSKIKEILVR